MRKELSYQLRRLRGKSLAAELILQMNAAFDPPGLEIEWVDLETTDLVSDNLLNAFHIARLTRTLTIRRYQIDCAHVLSEDLTAWSLTVPNFEMYLFCPLVSEYCGAILLPSAKAIQAAVSLLLQDENDVQACSYDGLRGFILEFDIEKVAGNRHSFYELNTWGF